MKQAALCEFFEERGEVAAMGSAFDIIAFATNAFSFSAAREGHIELLANATSQYSGRQQGSDRRPGSAQGPTTMRLQVHPIGIVLVGCLIYDLIGRANWCLLSASRDQSIRFVV